VATTDPLTDAEKVKLKRWFGYTGLSGSDGIAGQLAAVEGDYATEVRAIITRIDALESAEDQAALRGGLYERVEDVEFRGSEGAAMVATQRARLVRALASLMDIALAEGGAWRAGGISSGPIRRA
jgi:hypothetical protein